MLLGVTSTHGRVYVVGGWSGTTGQVSCEVYNVSTKIWQSIADMNQGRSQTAACAVNDGCVVAVGGCDAWNCTNTVEMYDPTNDHWTYMPVMSVSRRGAGVAFFNSMFLVIP